MSRSVAVAVAFLLSACAARTATFGASASGGAPPPLPPGAQVPLYDHYCAAFGGGRGGEAEFTRLLDAASSQGWEMVAVAGDTIFCFKRPRAVVAAPPATTP